MERVQELIDKLWKQHQQQERPERLLATVQSLQEALHQTIRNEASQTGGKVAVVLPPRRRNTTVAVSAATPPSSGQDATAGPQPAEAATTYTAPQPAPVPAEPVVVAESAPETPTLPFAQPFAAAVPPPPAPAVEPEPQPVRMPYALQKPAVPEYTPPPPPMPAPPPTPEPPKIEPTPQREVYHLQLDFADEAPTLTQQQFAQPQQPKELHEVISQQAESLNDKLRQDRPELAHILKDTPVKDLRKAIGVNDKFLFIRELFRGDEAMYERSIKTINGFHILAEAEYWISRELKVKLGWDDRSDVVQSFYHLVRRRFA